MKDDKMSGISQRIEDWVIDTDPADFWSEDGRVQLDYDLLKEAMSVPLIEGAGSNSGRLASAVDLWCAWEMRKAGFTSEGVWPSLTQPRVIDPGVSSLLAGLPVSLSGQADRLRRESGSVDANVMGSVFTKQVDVGMSSWLSGPELLVSTKTMSGSFGKNLSNRFEEAYGDVKNLRGRYPLAAHGFLFVVNSDIALEQGAYQKAIHMLGQLSRASDVYDAVALLVIDWDEEGVHALPAPVQSEVPVALSPEHFFAELVRVVLLNSPITLHELARALYPGVA